MKNIKAMNDHQRNVGNYATSNNLPETFGKIKGIRIRKRLLTLLLCVQIFTLVVFFGYTVALRGGLLSYVPACVSFSISVTMWFGFGRQVFNEYLLKMRIQYLTKEATRLWGISKSGSTPAVRLAAYELWKRLDAKRNEAMRIQAGEFEPEKINL